MDLWFVPSFVHLPLYWDVDLCVWGVDVFVHELGRDTVLARWQSQAEGVLLSSTLALDYHLLFYLPSYAPLIIAPVEFNTFVIYSYNSSIQIETNFFFLEKRKNNL